MRQFISGLLCLAVWSVQAQQDLTSPLLRGSWQSTFSNPALLHSLDGKITVGLPGIYNDLRSENITLGDVLVEEDGRRILDISRGIASLEERNELRDQADFETIGLAYRGKKWAFGFSHRIRYDGAINYPKTLVQVIWEGNAQFLGETVDIRPDLRIGGYHELAFSAAYKLTDKLSVGGRVKLLSGINQVSSQEGGRLTLRTDEVAFALELDQDYTINSAGALDYQDARNFDLDTEFARFTTDNLFGSNTGIAIDLGAQLDLGVLRIQAAAQDLGGTINWSKDVNNYTLSGTEAFTGLDVLENLLNDTASLSGIVDSLEEQFNPTETSTGFSTTVPSRYMLAGEFDLNERLTLGALLYLLDGFTEDSETAAAVSARFRVADFLSVGGVYGYRAGEFTNLGLNAILALGPARLLLATDNVFTVFRPLDANQANVRLGLSLSFGNGEE
ncbi:MAG: DUF5723 family protein [Bacteroidota bacterium]